VNKRSVQSQWLLLFTARAPVTGTSATRPADRSALLRAASVASVSLWLTVRDDA